MQVKKQTEQLKEQGLQVQQLLQISQSARETDAAAKATIEWLSQQVDQFKEDAEKSNEALRQARKEALEAKQLTTAASQSSASELPSRSILRNSPAIAMGTPTKASVRFSQARTPPDPMSDSDEEMSVVSQELVPMDKGKGKMVDQGHKEVRKFFYM